MTPNEFIAKWHNSPLGERAAAQSHFLDLCELLDEPVPAKADPTGKDFGFEIGASKSGGGRGFADVFKRNHFAWEYKSLNADLDSAFAQLQRYAIALDNPPLLIVSDIGRAIRIHTNWTNSVSKTYDIAIESLIDPEKRGWLKAALSDPETLKPGKTRRQLTEEVAGRFAELALRLRSRGHRPDLVAHFVNRLIFCMFAEDVKLLPDRLFAKMLDRAVDAPREFEVFARDLFAAMRSGGRVGFDGVPWFNGGLFDDDQVFSLTPEELRIVQDTANVYWADIDPSILGTLFERGLDPEKRSQLGAHYTDKDKIEIIVEEVIKRPLNAEWVTAKKSIEEIMERAASSTGAPRTRLKRQATAALEDYLRRLAEFRILDPACGSGNFLYLALKVMKDLEHRAQVEAEALGLPRAFPRIGPEVVKGIEINPFAAELARVSIWIGEIQWMIKNGFTVGMHPILKSLDAIECRDAVLAEAVGEAVWPNANVVIGNPPFLGSKYFRKGRRAGRRKEAMAGLGDDYTDRLLEAHRGQVAGSADLVTYWFHRVARLAEQQKIEGFGLIATKSIAKGATNEPLQNLHRNSTFRISSAWRNVPWVVDGADVRVSVVCARPSPTTFELDGQPVSQINTDLTTGIDVSGARRLQRNRGLAFQGVKLNGPFAISGPEARLLLEETGNPNGLPNSRVVKRFIQNNDVTIRDQDTWVIDFSDYPNKAEAALFQAPFEKLKKEVERHRAGMAVSRASEVERLEKFWLMQRPRPQLRAAASGLAEIIVVPETSEHLIFSIRSCGRGHQWEPIRDLHGEQSRIRGSLQSIS